MNRPHVLWLLMLLAALALSCGQPAPPLQVLSAPPPTAYRTLGMVSGQGENEESAVHHAAIQAERLEADALIIVGRRPLGRLIVVTARAIKYLAPPPQQ